LKEIRFCFREREAAKNMHLSTIKITNFRRLSDVKIDLDRDLSIFVGANNSGKTSVAQAMHIFLTGARDRVSLHDFSASRRSDIEAYARDEGGAMLPSMSIDLWFEVGANDLHRVLDLLPSLQWQGSRVGVRISFQPQNAGETRERFKIQHNNAQEQARAADGVDDDFVAYPRSLSEFLETEIKREYEFRYYVLDPDRFDDELMAKDDYEPLELVREQGRTGKEIVSSLIRVDYLNAQRHLSDSATGARSEDLSKHLSRYYARNLEKSAEDFNAIRALAQSEVLFNSHLEQVFSETLGQLSKLGYPGFANPKLIIKSALNPATVMSNNDGAHVHYALDDDGLTLPDHYNGLGYKNLIYMVVELLDLHAQWVGIEENRQPLHLVFVEEPEAHLHAQLQQVFVNKVLDILAEEDDGVSSFQSQLVLTTHSPHIVYERGFRPVRYFRREQGGSAQCSRVLNLSEFYKQTENPSRDFLERYLKLTHCDLFFADGVILVEGNVERLLMPQMIQKAASSLRSSYLSVLEIGGAFGDRFQSLIEFLGITTLIVTDLDSVFGPVPEGGEFFDDDDENDNEETKPGETCRPEVRDAVTSNQMLRRWLPGKDTIADLLSLSADEKTAIPDHHRLASVRVTYPGTVDVVLGEQKAKIAGRTLEEAFAFENLEWTQNAENRELKLRIPNVADLDQLTDRLHKRIHRPRFKKTDFALALLSKDPNDWIVPSYIAEGLTWLEKEIGTVEQNDGEI